MSSLQAGACKVRELRHQRKLGAGYRPRKPSKAQALECGAQALRDHRKCGLQAGARAQTASRIQTRERTCSKSHHKFVAKLGLEPRP